MAGESPDIVPYDSTGAALSGVSGSTSPTASIAIGGTDGTNLRTISTDNTGKQLVSINQGGIAASIAAANTSATTAQTALVVALSPNTLPQTPADNAASGTVSALNGNIIGTTGGCSSIVFDFQGTWAATFIFQAQSGNGIWVNLNVYNVNTGQIVSSITSNQMVIAQCGGYPQVRTISSLYTSGTATITWNAGSGSNITQIFNSNSSSLFIQGATADGTPSTSNPLLIAAQDGTNIQSILSDTSGRLQIVGAASPGTAATGNPVLFGASDGANAQTLRTLPIASTQSLLVEQATNQRAAYSASATFVVANTPTDIATITGSATKVIRITKIEITGIAATAQTQTVQLIRRSSANTGGTFSNMSSASFDTANAASTSTVVNYTANPTVLGTALGTIRQVKMVLSVSGTVSYPVIWDFGIRNGQSITLRGIAQIIAIAFSGTTIAGNSISVFIEWTEDVV